MKTVNLKKDETGNTLTFPAHSTAPRLFLEWVGEWQRKHNYFLTYTLNLIDDKEEMLNDLFEVKFADANVHPEHLKNCFEYIDCNLEDENDD